jgi:transcriptional regulator with XRE-family HTH domain
MDEMLNDRLKNLLREKGLNQKQLAEKAQLTEAAVSKYLSGARRPQLKVLGSLATVLGTTTDYLVGVKGIEGDRFKILEEAIRQNKGSLTAEEKMRLILLITQN